MIDKEQIMIDGVDIIDCDYFYVEQETDQVKCDNYSGYCRQHKNCPFKQLIRKTQECEELKRKVELMMDCPDCKIDEYKKALEEIEQHCNEQNLKYDTTACEILTIINKAKGEGDE